MTIELARRYRPRRLEDLVGQETLVRILAHAFEKGLVGQSYLLTGIRGCGKTSTARIIATSINCEKGPTSTPCLVCENCRSIMEGRSPDVIEIDAASNTGVDDVRALIESVRYAPVALRRKIVIVDEVHMLSRNAFNALLKTLEEPPSYVVFILATTEFRKLPATIVSRCQRFDLKRIPLSVLKSHLAWVAELEGFAFEDGAIDLLARAGDGSMRDALSIMEQAASGAMFSEPDVRSILGLAAKGVSSRVAGLALEGKAQAALALSEEAVSAGADPVQILKDMLDLTHAACVLKAAPSADLSSAYTPRELELAAKAPGSLESAGQAWKIVLAALEDAQTAPAPRQSLDMAIVRIALRAKAGS